MASGDDGKHRTLLGMAFSDLERRYVHMDWCPLSVHSQDPGISWPSIHFGWLNEKKRWQLAQWWYPNLCGLREIWYLLRKKRALLFSSSHLMKQSSSGWLIPFYRWISIAAKHPAEQGHKTDSFPSCWSPCSGPWCFSFRFPKGIPTCLRDNRI